MGYVNKTDILYCKTELISSHPGKTWSLDNHGVSQIGFDQERTWSLLESSKFLNLRSGGVEEYGLWGSCSPRKLVYICSSQCEITGTQRGFFRHVKIDGKQNLIELKISLQKATKKLLIFLHL